MKSAVGNQCDDLKTNMRSTQRLMNVSFYFFVEKWKCKCAQHNSKFPPYNSEGNSCQQMQMIP